MVAKMVVRVGHRHIEDDPFPKLLKIVLRFRTVCTDEGGDIKIARPVRAGSAVCLAQQRHGRGEMNAPFPIAIKALYQKGAAVFGRNR